MSILLTGATGFIGSAVLRQLRLQGRDVTALVRDAEKAASVEALGATAAIGEATDRELVEKLSLDSDGVIHLAAPGDETAEAFDDAFVTAVFAGLEGSDKPYVHTGGIWVYGSGSDIDEQTPQNPPAITAWRNAVEQRVLDAVGVKTTLVVPAVVFGYGTGIPSMLVGDAAAAGADAAVQLVGDGTQHWTTVHVDDLAELYLLAFDLADGGTTYIGASGQNPTARELGVAASEGAGLGGRVVEATLDETSARFGRPFAEALLLDQQARGSAARIDLGWEPNGPSLVDELRTGSYSLAKV